MEGTLFYLCVQPRQKQGTSATVLHLRWSEPVECRHFWERKPVAFVQPS
jgi:hypothetical protein